MAAANVLISSNASGINGKWLPYIYKPFFLGVVGDETGDDDNTYVTRVDTTPGDDVRMAAMCTSAHNCGYYYDLVFIHSSGGDYFHIKKYNSNDEHIENIYASTISGDGRYWKVTISYVTIDVGVHVYFPTTTGFALLQIYRIELPSLETMEKNRLYHGGYSTFLRLPYTEDIAFHSDPIPTSLENKNMTILLGQLLSITKDRASLKIKKLIAFASLEDSLGNSAVSLALQWNAKKDGVHSASDRAGNVADAWGGGETWSLGTLVVDDVSPIDVTPGGDIPALASSPFSDVTADTYISGENQILNTTVAGRAGTAAVRLAYFDGVGSPTINAYNQFWPITIMLS